MANELKLSNAQVAELITVGIEAQRVADLKTANYCFAVLLEEYARRGRERLHAIHGQPQMVLTIETELDELPCAPQILSSKHKDQHAWLYFALAVIEFDGQALRMPVPLLSIGALRFFAERAGLDDRDREREVDSHSIVPRDPNRVQWFNLPYPLPSWVLEKRPAPVKGKLLTHEAAWSRRKATLLRLHRVVARKRGSRPLRREGLKRVAPLYDDNLHYCLRGVAKQFPRTKIQAVRLSDLAKKGITHSEWRDYSRRTFTVSECHDDGKALYTLPSGVKILAEHCATQENGNLVLQSLPPMEVHPTCGWKLSYALVVETTLGVPHTTYKGKTRRVFVVVLNY